MGPLLSPPWPLPNPALLHFSMLYFIAIVLAPGAPVVERMVAEHIGSLLLNGEWQDISARGQCDMRATRNTMPSHSSSHSRAPEVSRPPGFRAPILLGQDIKGTQPDQNSPVIVQERTTGPQPLRTWISRG